MNWIKITDWYAVPLGSKITLWTNNCPSGGWYSKTIHSILNKIENDRVDINYSDGSSESYYVSTLDRHEFRYLQEYEPYDPSQEGEDDCV